VGFEGVLSYLVEGGEEVQAGAGVRGKTLGPFGRVHRIGRKSAVRDPDGVAATFIVAENISFILKNAQGSRAFLLGPVRLGDFVSDFWFRIQRSNLATRRWMGEEVRAGRAMFRVR